MDNIIGRIVEMDKKARDAVNETRRLKDRQLGSLAGDKNKVEGELLERAKHRIEVLKTTTQEEAHKEADSIEDVGRRNIEDLEKYFETNRARFEEMLFERCIRGSDQDG